MEVSENQRKPVFRHTVQREAILRALQKARCHLTADEVYERVRRELPRISLGTVYRNLETLAARGLIGRVDLAGQQRRYEANTAEHAHLRCATCGRIIDLPAVELEGIKREAEEESGRKITGFNLEFTAGCIGLCELEADETAE